MKKYRAFLILVLCLGLLIPALSLRAQAKDLDEIQKYTIQVDVNDNGTLHMIYHVDWLVLDSDSEGPLEWVKIGIPNSHYQGLTGRSAAVRKISDMHEYGETFARIDLDRKYYAGEVAVIEFELDQDYMYQVDMMTEGETVYSLTPGWFDDIRVDEMTIRWNADKTLSYSPACTVEDGYLTWSKPLAKGEIYNVSVTYPNSAYGFDTSKQIISGTDDGGEGGGDGIASVFGGLMALLFIALPIALPILFAVQRYKQSANLTGGQKKITRTKVEYYPVCQGCGAARPEGANNCAYCGRSFIKSEEVVEEKDIPAEEKELRRKTTNGLYRYSHDPNTYIRVNVINVPVVRSHPVSHSSSRSSGSSSRSSSCFHSSCACACACACAGGGRAGCTTKDFYNTDLKLRQLELKQK